MYCLEHEQKKTQRRRENEKIISWRRNESFCWFLAVWFVEKKVCESEWKRLVEIKWRLSVNWSFALSLTFKSFLRKVCCIPSHFLCTRNVRFGQECLTICPVFPGFLQFFLIFKLSWKPVKKSLLISCFSKCLEKPLRKATKILRIPTRFPNILKTRRVSSSFSLQFLQYLKSFSRYLKKSKDIWFFSWLRYWNLQVLGRIFPLKLFFSNVGSQKLPQSPPFCRCFPPIHCPENEKKNLPLDGFVLLSLTCYC